MKPRSPGTHSALWPVLAHAIACTISLIGFGGECSAASLPEPASHEIIFSKDIKPVLERSCLQCHSGDKPKGNFRMDSREALLKGGESKEASIVPGESASSQMVRFAADAVGEMEMPPLEKRNKFAKLTEREIGILRGWIDQGAQWPDGVTLRASVVAPAEKEQPLAKAQPASLPVFEMIRRGDQAGIIQALKNPAVLSARDESGNTPLIQAAFYLEARQLSLFLDKGAEINATNKAGVTALMKAVWDLKKTRLLLKHKANLNVASKMGNTALIIACYGYGAAPVIKELIAHGADVQAANAVGGNAVTAAAESGDVEVLRIVLNHGGNPNSKMRIGESNGEVSALMTAAQLGHLEFVRILLDRGADVNLTTEHGNALCYASFTGRQRVVRLLLDRGANAKAAGRRLLSFRKDTGLTALMYAALNERNDPTITQWLINAGADVNAKDSIGETALSIARQRGNTKIVSALLATGANDEHRETTSAREATRWSSAQVEYFDARLARKAAEAGVAILVKSGARMTEVTANRCASCHQQNLAAVAWSTASQKGVEFPVELARNELSATIRGSQRSKEMSIEQPLPVPNIASWLLIGLDAAHHPADALSDQFAYALARHQYQDGRWITKAARPPTDYSDVTSTAVAIRALKAYAPPTMKKRIDRNIAKAAAWLRTYPTDSTEESAMQILGLRWAGLPESELKKFALSLKAAQRQDGGWAQIATLESDAYATGLALHALHRSGALAVSDPAYQAGVKFLLKTQLEDGSWFVPTRASPVQVAIDDIFPHGNDQWMSSMATSWASISLMYASAPGDEGSSSHELKAAR